VARCESRSVTLMADHGTVYIPIPFNEDAEILDGEELVSAHCWNQISVSVNLHLLLNFLKHANGAVLFYASEDKSRVLVQMAAKRLLLVAFESSTPMRDANAAD